MTGNVNFSWMFLLNAAENDQLLDRWMHRFNMTAFCLQQNCVDLWDSRSTLSLWFLCCYRFQMSFPVGPLWESVSVHFWVCCHIYPSQFVFWVFYCEKVCQESCVLLICLFHYYASRRLYAANNLSLHEKVCNNEMWSDGCVVMCPNVTHFHYVFITFTVFSKVLLCLEML